MPKLVCQSGPTAGHEYALTKDVTILGRQSSCDVQIHDEMSSRAHCQVRRDGRLYSLVDLGSRNGTLLNGKKVSERLMSFGDKIRVGKVEYLFVKESGDAELKDLLSKYEILEKIGEGGMGIVYKANQRSMARVVALKILSPKYSSKPKFVEQFTREARSAGSLNHPNIIQVHDVGTENEIHYFSMEFVDGPTCMQVLKANGPFPVEDAMEIVRQTAKALEYAHAHRLIHQDIKPDNIMLGPNNIVKLADLGISKTFDEVEAEEGPKKVMGTPHYMAPEAALGKKVDQRVDIYSLGATVYHLLCGKTPFHGSSPTEVLKHHVMDELPPITEVNPGVPPKVVALIDRMMAKKAEERIQSATEIIEEIRRIIGSESTAGAAGGETMILRRYARGAGAAASVPTPASLTTGSRTPGGENTTPGDGVDSVGDSRLRTLNRVLVAGIVVVVVVCVAIAASAMGSKETPVPPPATAGAGTGTGVATGGGVADPGTRPDTPQGPNAAEQAQAKRQQLANRLAALDGQLTRDGDGVNTQQAQQELDRITDEQLDGTNLERAKAIGERIEQILQRRRTQQVQAAYQQLEKDVVKLAGDRDYANALRRLDGFPHSRDAAVRVHFDKLRGDVDKQRNDYLAEMSRRIKDLADAKDVARLKEMLQALPQALLDSPVHAQILAAIKAIEDDKQKGHQQTATEAGRHLCEWRFTELERLARSSREAMTGPAAAQFDQYREAGQRLQAMVEALGAKIRSVRSVRYRGALRGMDNPDLVDATLDGGVELVMGNGGSGNLKWSSLSGDDLVGIATAVLGKDADPYKTAIATLAAAKAALPAPAPKK